MQPTEQTSFDPLAPLVELLFRIVSTTLHLLIGTAVGLLLTSVMRRWNLRWTWAAASFSLLVFVRLALAQTPGAERIVVLGLAALPSAKAQASGTPLRRAYGRPSKVDVARASGW
jgi:hypothetical protein